MLQGRHGVLRCGGVRPGPGATIGLRGPAPDNVHQTRRAHLSESLSVVPSARLVAPMSLLTYEDVRPWARLIKQKVTTRVMPPWHIDRNVGIQTFKDDRSLTDREIGRLPGGGRRGAAWKSRRHAAATDVRQRAVRVDAQG